MRNSFYQARQYADRHPTKAALTVLASWLALTVFLSLIGAAVSGATAILFVVVLPHFAGLPAAPDVPSYTLIAAACGAALFAIYAQVLILTDLRHFIAQAIGRKAFG